MPAFRIAHLLLLIGLAAPAMADGQKHLGAVTCASSNCHGKVVQEDAATVQMNEHRIWSTQSRHARAYDTLQSPKARQIAQRMGLPSAQAAPQCLACHSNLVPEEQRGPRFSLADGVSCEACHGAASEWIRTHSSASSNHVQNLANGLAPLDDPGHRAQVCTRCHVGNEDTIATHQMMVAGHPRLIFELDAFTTNQPRHHTMDADYRVRKPAASRSSSNYALWLFGQVAAARAYLGVIATNADRRNGPWPEFSLFDCHACHHPMNDPGRIATANLPPGKARLQNQHFIMLMAAIRVLSPDRESAMGTLHNRLLLSPSLGQAAMRDRALQFDSAIAELSQSWQTRAIGLRELGAMRSEILRQVREGVVTNYADAAQVYLGLESLSRQIGDFDRLEQTVDAIFDEVAQDVDYDATKFRATVERARGRF